MGYRKGQASQQAHHAANSPLAHALARAGYLARGVVYVIVGALAAKVAAGGSGATTGQKGALDAIYHEPFGKVLLGIVCVGLVGYALWCFIRAIMDADGQGTGAKGMLARAGYAVVGVIYLALTAAAVQLIRSGSTNTNSNSSAQGWTARLLDKPYGEPIVVIGGLIIIGIALYQFYRAYKESFKKYLKLGEMSSAMRTWLVNLGKAGIAARAVVFCIIGVFVIVAAVTHNARQAKGLGGALQTLAQQPYGQFLLAIVALGFVAYGIYSFGVARYRRLGTA